MNAKRSLILALVNVVIFVGVFWGFIHGVQLEATGPKVGWILGSLLVGVLTVRFSYLKWIKK